MVQCTCITLANLKSTCSDPGFFSGGVQARLPEDSLDNVVCLFLSSTFFYSLQRGSNGFITENTILFQGSSGGTTLYRGFQLFPGGVQMLIYIETLLTCFCLFDSLSPINNLSVKQGWVFLD